MDIKKKRQVPGGQGASAAERCNIVDRAGSWQYGAAASNEDIEAEKREQSLKFGVPYEDNFPDPAANNSDGGAALPNPHNFSNNPGFISTGQMMQEARPETGGTATIRTSGAPSSTGRSVRQDGPNRAKGGRESTGGSVSGSTVTGDRRGVSVGRSATIGNNSVAMPAPGDTLPESEGSPLNPGSGVPGR